MQVKTQKGSVIKRSKYGIGKNIGGCIYFHRSYVSEYFPKLIDETGYKHLYYGRTGNLLKWNTVNNNVTIFQCSDFDTCHEPTVGEWEMATPEGKYTSGRSTQLLHHKWLWVDEKYYKFDVQESYERSKKWLAIPDINFHRIGNKDYWYTLLRKHNISF